MLRIVSAEFGKAFPGKMDQIPSPEMVKGMTYDQIMAALQCGAPTMA